MDTPLSAALRREPSPTDIRSTTFVVPRDVRRHMDEGRLKIMRQALAAVCLEAEDGNLEPALFLQKIGKLHRDEQPGRQTRAYRGRATTHLTMRMHAQLLEAIHALSLKIGEGSASEIMRGAAIKIVRDLVDV